MAYVSHHHHHNFKHFVWLRSSLGANSRRVRGIFIQHSYSQSRTSSHEPTHIINSISANTFSLERKKVFEKHSKLNADPVGPQNLLLANNTFFALVVKKLTKNTSQEKVKCLLFFYNQQRVAFL